MRAEVVGLDADVQRDVERHEARRVDLEVVAGHPERLEVARAGRSRTRRRPRAPPTRSAVTKTVCHEPVQRNVAAARCTRGLRSLTSRVVVLGDRALLDEVRLGRVAADRVGRLRVDAAGRRQRVRRRRRSPPSSVDDVRDRARADVAGGAVADAVRRLEHGARPRAGGRGRRRRSAASRRRRARPRRRTPAASPSLPSRSSCGVHGSVAPSSVPSSATAGRAARGSAAIVAAAEAGRANTVSVPAVEPEQRDGHAVADRPDVVAAADDGRAGAEARSRAPRASRARPGSKVSDASSAASAAAVERALRRPRASAPRRACVTGALRERRPEADRDRLRLGSRSHGSQPSSATRSSTGAGTVAERLVRRSCGRGRRARCSPTPRRRRAPGRSSTEMQSGNGSASASSHAISVTATAAFVGGSSKSPPDGSLDGDDVREPDGGALRRVGVLRVAGQRARRPPRARARRPPSAPDGRRRASPRSRRAAGSSRRRPTSRSRSARATA